VFEAAVDRFGGSVAGGGPVEVGQHVGCALGQGSFEGDEFGQRVWDAALRDPISVLIRSRPRCGRVRGRR
jgi:hypothetical protein